MLPDGGSLATGMAMIPLDAFISILHLTVGGQNQTPFQCGTGKAILYEDRMTSCWS